MLSRYSKADVTAAEAHLRGHTLAQIAARMKLDALSLMIAADRFGGTCSMILADVDFVALETGAACAAEAAEYDYHEVVPAGPDPRERFVGTPGLMLARAA